MNACSIRVAAKRSASVVCLPPVRLNFVCFTILASASPSHLQTHQRSDLPQLVRTIDTQLEVSYSSLMGSAYEYTALDDARRQIRLLHLHPSVNLNPEEISFIEGGDVSSTINCTFTLASLDEDPSYEALSYVWGDTKAIASIVVHGHQFQVTSHLKSILEHLRYEDRERVLWIDALCIHQHDVDEQSRQVAVMHRIYRQASQVNVFLGEVWERCDDALDFIEFVADNTDLHFNSFSGHSMRTHGFDIQSGPQITSIRKLFDLPWWTRVWTVQEYLLARKVVFRIGPRTLDADDLKQFVQHCHLHKKCCSLSSISDAGGARDGIQRAAVLQYVADKLRHWNSEFIDLVNAFGLRQCSNPSDKVYGMLGLADNSFRKLIPVDYSRSTMQVYRDMTVAAITQSGTLNYLSYLYGSSTQSLGLPSWVYNFPDSLGDIDHARLMRRLGPIRKIFRASQDSKPNLACLGQERATTGAFLVDTINEILIVSTATTSWESVSACRSALNVVHTWKEPYESTSEAIWGTFCGGVSGQPSTSNIWYKPIQEQDAEVFDEWTAWLGPRHRFSQDSTATEEQVEGFNYAFSLVAFGRSFAITANGYIGWVPEKAEKGDVVALLPGGRVPYVLRRIMEPSRTRESDGGQHGDCLYRFLGDAYIHGIMHGEAWDEAKLEAITLV